MKSAKALLKRNVFVRYEDRIDALIRIRVTFVVTTTSNELLRVIMMGLN